MKFWQPLITMAGDFNETLSGPIYRGTREGRELLREKLQSSSLVCVTENLPNCLDHICLSPGLAAKVISEKTRAWASPVVGGKAASDHPAISIELAF